MGPPLRIGPGVEESFLGDLTMILFVLAMLLFGVTVVLVKHTFKRTRLPVVAPPPVKKACESCKHFDLAEGQAVLRQFPAFMAAAAVVSPAQIARTVQREYERPCKLCNGTGTKQLAGGTAESCLGCDGKGTVLEQELSPPAAPQKAQWTECGACLKDEVVVWGGELDKPCWEAK